MADPEVCRWDDTRLLIGNCSNSYAVIRITLPLDTPHYDLTKQLATSPIYRVKLTPVFTHYT